MPRLFAALIRHGSYHQRPETPSAFQPFPLNGDGEEQARAAGRGIAQHLRAEGWSLDHEVECSSLLRAWQTAQLICGEMPECFDRPAELVAHDALAERCVGSAANLSLGEIESVLRDDPRHPEPPAGWKSDSHYRLPLPGAESLVEAGERVAVLLAARMEELARIAERDTLKLFVGHGAAFRHAAWHLGVLAFDDIARFSMYHAQPVYLECCNDGTWRHHAGDWKVRDARTDAPD